MNQNQLFISTKSHPEADYSNVYDRISVRGTEEDLAYSEVKPVSKEDQPSHIQLSPCPAYISVNTAANTRAESSLAEVEYDYPINPAAAEVPADP